MLIICTYTHFRRTRARERIRSKFAAAQKEGTHNTSECLPERCARAHFAASLTALSSEPQTTHIVETHVTAVRAFFTSHTKSTRTHMLCSLLLRAHKSNTFITHTRHTHTRRRRHNPANTQHQPTKKTTLRRLIRTHLTMRTHLYMQYFIIMHTCHAKKIKNVRCACARMDPGPGCAHQRAPLFHVCVALSFFLRSSGAQDQQRRRAQMMNDKSVRVLCGVCASRVCVCVWSFCEKYVSHVRAARSSNTNKVSLRP